MRREYHYTPTGELYAVDIDDDGRRVTVTDLEPEDVQADREQVQRAYQIWLVDTESAFLARQLAARRPRATYHCFQCGKLFEATIQRGKRAPTTCSPKCRQALYRQTKQQQRETGR